MKKLFIVFMTLLIISLVGCGQVSTTEAQTTAATTAATTTESTTETTTIPETTTELITYDDRSLVPESCSSLENIDDWQPVWCEEFNYVGLPDSTKWSYDVGGSGWGNNELQYYTNADEDNAYVSDGTLNITAINESFGGMDYTSARLISKYKGEWLYGKIEIRAKLPEALGSWSAAWMLPTDWAYGGWPYSGEIDIMEHVGYNPDVIHGTIHTGEYNGSNGNQIGYSRTEPDVTEEFHVYELVWEPSKMEVYFDGELYGTFGYNPIVNVDVENTDAWPFDQRFHLLLNVAVGGNWGGAQGVAPGEFPAVMEVDYVRVYQKDYAGMDQEAPTAISNLSIMNTTHSTLKFSWVHATDDIKVKEYVIYSNDEYIGRTTVNAYLVEDLDPETQYSIEVYAVDFDGNISPGVSLSVSTESVRSVLGKIEAESYDNQSGVVRIDCEDIGGGYNVGWIDDNDYMEYVLSVEEYGTYKITYRVASESNGGEIKLYGKSILPLSTLSFASTGGWQVWTDEVSDTFTLTEGVYTFKIKASDGGFNLNYFEFEKVE